MRVYMVPMDTGACGYFRIREPARVARRAGVDVQIANEDPNLPEKYRGIPIASRPDQYGNEEIIELRIDADVIVIQRPLMQPALAIAIQARKQGIKVVVEMDDDLHAVHRGNGMAGAIDPKRQPLHNIKWAARTIDWADMLIVSTPAIANRYGPHKSVVVRNWLPEHILPLAPGVSPARHVVGWTGSLNVHPQDMQETGGGVRALPEPFTVVGQAEGVAAALRLPESQVRLGAAWQESIPDYWRVVPQHIGIGIAPLQLSAFNRAKSALKVSEYQALGIPWVASPTPEYQLMAEQSRAGIIASSRGQWQRALQRLLKDDTAYEDMRAAGLAWARENTLEHHIDQHINAWEKAMNMGRTRPRVIH